MIPTLSARNGMNGEKVAYNQGSNLLCEVIFMHLFACIYLAACLPSLRYSGNYNNLLM